MITIVGFWRRRPASFQFERSGITLTMGLWLFWILISLWGLWNPWFHGLPSIGGGDAGVHLELRRLFVNPEVIVNRFNLCNKFVTFYAFTHWAERLFGYSPFESFRFGFYAIPWTFWISLAAAVAITARPCNNPSARMTAAFSVSGVSALVILLPLFHYHQAEGFYALLFGVAPMMAAWASYGVAESALSRATILIVWLVADRFTYGVNLGDTLLTIAFLLTLEARRWPRVSRWLTLAGATGLVGATIIFWVKLAAYINLGGHIASARRVPLLVGEGALVMLLAFLPRLNAEGSRTPLGRLITFAVVNGALNVCGQLLWLASPLPGGYYFERYSLHTSVLLAGAAATLGPVVLFQVQEKHRAAARFIGVAFLSALTCLAFAFPRQQDGFAERMIRRSPPWRHLRPLADLEGLKRIESTLASAKKPCLVLLTPSWPMSSFMNGSLGVLERWHSIPEGPLDRRGKCAFWYGGDDDIAAMTRYSRPNVIGSQTAYAMGLASERLARELDANSSKTCEEYTAEWDPGRRLRLCHLCFD